MILVATDFSPGADAALASAIELGRRLDEAIEIVHVHPMSATPTMPSLEMSVSPPAAQAVADAEMALADRVSRAKAAGVRAEGHSRFGQPAAEVLARINQSAPTLVVLGRHSGHGRLQHLLVGSVTKEISQHAPCPTVIVPPPAPAAGAR